MIEVPDFVIANGSLYYGRNWHEMFHAWIANPYKRYSVSYYCRDSFTYYLDRGIKDFYYSLNNKKQIDSVIKFINRFQKRSKIPEKHILNIEKTNSPNVLYVKLNDFWKERVRFSLLLALLRVGKGYDGKNFIKRLNVRYFKNRKSHKAVRLFMKGYFYHTDIQFLYRESGWINYCYSIKSIEDSFSKVKTKKFI